MADNSSLLTIKLNVYNTLFTVHTKREDEESYRKSAKLVTDLMNFYSEKFKGIKSEKDIQLMVMRHRHAVRTNSRTKRHKALHRNIADADRRN